jgi:hypothetical protein
MRPPPWISFLAAALSACTAFDHGPVETPLANDPKTLGYWRTNEVESGVYLVEEAGPDQLRITGFEKNGCPSPKPEMARRTEIGGVSFLEFGGPDGSSFLSYRPLTDGKFILAGPLDDAFEKAVTDGTLSGAIEGAEKTNTRHAHVTASTAELRRFLAEHPEVMGSKEPFILTRADGAPRCEKN